MRISIRHLTRHTYGSPVSFSEHKVFLRPLDSHHRRVNHFGLRTTPNSTQRWVRDVYGNIVLLCNFGLFESAVLEFEATMEVTLTDDNPFDFILEPYATAFPFNYCETETRALLPFLNRDVTDDAREVLNWFNGAVPYPQQHSDIVRFLSDLNEAIHRDIFYVRRDEEGIQTPDTTLGLRSGSCRDMAVLFIAVARQLGLAARFVSGYLFDPPNVATGAPIFNRAAGSMHAWAEVYLPGAGWKGFDPTNGILANNFFVPSAVSHEPSAIDPIQGTYFTKNAATSWMEVDLEIQEVHEKPGA